MSTETVHLFVFDTLADWEPGFAIAGINNPAYQKNSGRYRVQTVGIDTRPVTTIGGVRMQPDLALTSLNPADSAMLILPGGEAWDQGKNGEAIEKAKEFLAAKVPVAAICGATFGLARGGILDTRHHTSNAREYLAMSNYKGDTLYRDEAAVTDQDVITASAMKSLDFARHIFLRLDIYPEYALEAWYRLFSTGDMSHFLALQQQGDK